MSCKVEVDATQNSIFPCSPVETISLRKFSKYSALICLKKLNRVETCDICALESTFSLRTTRLCMCVSVRLCEFYRIVIDVERLNGACQRYLFDRHGEPFVPFIKRNSQLDQRHLCFVTMTEAGDRI